MHRGAGRRRGTPGADLPGHQRRLSEPAAMMDFDRAWRELEAYWARTQRPPESETDRIHEALERRTGPAEMDWKDLLAIALYDIGMEAIFHDDAITGVMKRA